jgi:hypothetical protein
MRLILNRYTTSVNELSLSLDKQGWGKLVELVQNLQKDGEHLDLHVTSKEAFLDSLEKNEIAIGILFDQMIADGIGQEYCYVDPTNESYGVSVEK